MTHDERYESRQRKLQKIMAILHDFAGLDLSELTCLDIGCSQGGISQGFAAHFQSTFAMDIEAGLVRQAAATAGARHLAYLVASGHEVPLPVASVDVVICAQVYEHVTDQNALAGEVWRVLRPGGLCFFSGPNRLALVEEHYWLPFLSWPPRWLSNLYMRIFRRGREYDAYPLFYWQIRRLWRGFQIHDYTLKILLEPQRFSMDRKVGRLGWLRRLPAWLLKDLAPFYPNYNWILVKPGEE